MDILGEIRIQSNSEFISSKWQFEFRLGKNKVILIDGTT
jgi:hypothetical protein